MTSTNTNAIQEAVAGFRSLIIDDELLVLALLYRDVAGSVPADAANALPTQDAANLVTRVEQLSPQENQLSALRDFLGAERNDQDATILDPNPSKALAELVTGGGTTIPAHEYSSLSAEARIAFWYLLAQRLGSNIIGNLSEFTPTEQVTIVLNSIQSLNTDELVSFLKHAL
ncbi:orange carotenoid protein N-terminal domain-containing protein [Mastigocladopsis repens]|uniref:orange carotenoid protein N-terminal domain-containing protein n=1 Tax=Mastigocladopsis repens TaxID=221287 RepID=UPI0002E40671|nr:orange carotenoid protein N-terminal domain-containing protein [Mastigocladopsis repens]